MCYHNMARFSILFIGLLLFFLNLHAQEETMSEGERQELLAKSDSLLVHGDELCNSGNYAQAISLSTEAMHIYEKVYGKEHPDYAQSLNKLASYYSKLGNYTEAIRLGTEAMNIWEELYGKEHPNYATSLTTLRSTIPTWATIQKL